MTPLTLLAYSYLATGGTLAAICAPRAARDLKAAGLMSPARFAAATLMVVIGWPIVMLVSDK